VSITTDLIGTPAAGSGTSTVANFGGTVGSGNGAVVLITSASRGASTVVDSAGHSYTKGPEVSFFGAIFAAIWYRSDASGATTVTANFASATACTVVPVSVVGTLTLNASNSRSSNNTTQTPNSINTSVANTIVFAVDNTSNAPTTPSGFTALYSTGAVQASYAIFTATQTGLTPTWTVSPSSPFAAAVAAFESSDTSGSASAALSDLLVWSGTFDAEKSDVLTWTDIFTTAPPVTVSETLTDTITWTATPATEENLRDTITWEVTTFPIIESFGRVGDTLTWSDEFGADINLLAAARYRR
jgi:hypothetical protein